MKVETFPSLKTLSLNLIVGEDDDLSPIAEFCATNPGTKIRFDFSDIFQAKMHSDFYYFKSSVTCKVSQESLLTYYMTIVNITFQKHWPVL